MDQDINATRTLNPIAYYKRLNSTVVQKTTISRTDDGVERLNTFACKTDKVGVYTELVQNDNNSYNEYNCTILYLDEVFYLAYLCRDLEDGDKHEGNYRY